MADQNSSEPVSVDVEQGSKDKDHAKEEVVELQAPAAKYFSTRCVVCQAPDVANGSLKILSCLHTMCMSCLREVVWKDGTVSCSRCLKYTAGIPSVRLEDSLVDWPLSASAMNSDCDEPEFRKVVVCQDPQCEGEWVPAASFCVKCDLHLCEGHISVHKGKRATRDHPLVVIEPAKAAAGSSAALEPAAKAMATCSRPEKNDPLEGKISFESSARPDAHPTATGMNECKCPVHPHVTATWYCAQCKMMCCEKCSDKAHASHPREDFQPAEQKLREEWRSNLEEHVQKDTWREKLMKATTDVEARLHEINDEVDKLSKEIYADFDEHIENLRQRQHELLHELDIVRWKALKRLEKQADIVEKRIEHLDRCEYLVENLSGSSALAVSEILDAQLTEVVNVSKDAANKGEVLPRVDLGASYESFATVEKRYASSLGAVVDAGFHEESAKKVKAGPVRIRPTFDLVPCTHNPAILPDNDRYGITSTFPGTVTLPTVGCYSHGIVECCIQVKSKGTELTLGVVRDSERNTGSIQGWSGSSGNTLGQPWEAGDLIKLSLDCAHGRLNGVHLRSGATHSVSFQTKLLPVCFVASIIGGRIRMVNSY